MANAPVTPPFMGGDIPGVTGNPIPLSSSSPGAPITRPSFLQAFLSGIGPGLAGGLLEASKNPQAIGAALGGSLEGIQQQKQQDFTNALTLGASQRANQQLAQQARAQASTQAYQAAETNRLNTITPLEEQEKQLGVDAMRASLQFYSNPTNLDSATQDASKSLGPLAKNEQAQIDAAKKDAQLTKTFKPVSDAIKTISQDRLTRGMSNESLTAAAAQGDKGAQLILDYRNQQATKQAGAQAAATAAARQPYELQLKNMEMANNPVFAVNPATKARELTTVAEAKAKGYSNPIKASQGDVEKETQLTSQVNDMQLNTSRYRVALNAMSNLSAADRTAMTHILSDPSVNNLLLQGAGFPAVISMAEQAGKGRDWNALSPDKQDALIGYLRMKNTGLLAQKVLTGMGRASKEALDIELANMPSPIEGATVGNKKLDAWQQNIDQMASRTVKLPWMPSPQELKGAIENAPQATPPARTTGQYRGTPSMDTGQKAYKVGMVALTRQGPKVVSKVYPDGSFDVQ